jgi:monovalent cation/proton antiporter MnhG/PhaG subunit
VSARGLAADGLVVAGAVILLLSAVGQVLRRDVRDRIHYASLAAIVGAPLVALGLALVSTPWRSGVKIVLIGAVVVVSGPIVSSVTARAIERSSAAARRRQR